MRPKVLKESNWQDFEEFCGALWEEKGWRTEVTDGRKDGGADVIGHSGSESICIQCKRQRNHVGVSAIGQVERARNRHGGPRECKAVVVTTAKDFTSQARSEALETPNLRLIDRSDLMSMIRRQEAEGLALSHLATQRGKIYSIVQDRNDTSLDAISNSTSPLGLTKEETHEILQEMEDDGVVKDTWSGWEIATVYL